MPTIKDDAKYHIDVFAKEASSNDDISLSSPGSVEEIRESLAALKKAESIGLVDKLEEVQSTALSNEGTSVGVHGEEVTTWGAESNEPRNDLIIEKDGQTFKYADGKFLIDDQVVTDDANLQEFGEVLDSYLDKGTFKAPVPELEKSVVDRVAIAESTSVRVGDNGTGVYIGHSASEDTMYILTNAHVIRSNGGNPETVTLADGVSYDITGIKSYDEEGKDLALISVKGAPSDTLTAARFAKASKGDKVTAAGYPSEEILNFQQEQGIAGGTSKENNSGNTFYATDIEVTEILSENEEGYSVGTTPGVIKGMSGGPLLNEQGEVVGINGKHAFPLFGQGADSILNDSYDYVIPAEEALGSVQEDLPEDLK